ncbi:tetratricopeptide repeat protein [uncultured Desulfosarcina sp.]|uniref:tetratricopeptide repeat protein n=1 Tax=uncultured Desulfosarcina sp. TaxID=218289 RepID=UPI0029C6246B|nr:tetratricopeptide repeat protein [uncultured Desulfosarcina sp.]
MRTNPRPWQTRRSCLAWLLPALMLAALSGCVTGGNVKPEPAEPLPPPAEQTAAAIPAEARAPEPEGIVIAEYPDMSPAARMDFVRAVALLNAGDDKGAIGFLETVMEASPNVSAPYINLGIAYARTGQADKAEAQFKKALELAPGHPVACNAYGLLCRRAGRFDEARTLYEQALARYPLYYPVHKNLGILCDLYLNDLACALEHYEQYSEAKPDDKQVDAWIADLRNRMGVQ